MSPNDLEGFLSTLYHSLRTERRRSVIRVLAEADSRTLSTRELAREIAASELGVSTAHATGEPYRNAYNALTQTHLPTLSSSGIIVYDPERQVVSRGAHFELASLLLDTNMSTVGLIQSLTSADGERESE